MSSCPWMISQMNIIWFICIDWFFHYFTLDYCFILFAFLGPKIKSRFIKMPPLSTPQKKKTRKMFLKKANIQPLYQRSLSFACSIQVYLGKILPELSKIFVEHALHVTRIQFQPRPNNSALGKAARLWPSALSINRCSPLEKPVLAEKTRLTSPEVQAAATDHRASLSPPQSWSRRSQKKATQAIFFFSPSFFPLFFSVKLFWVFSIRDFFDISL